MPRFFATCARGLEPILGQELEKLNAESIELGRGGVGFSGDLSLLYQACLWVRTAVRILRPIMEETVRSTDELYDRVRDIDWFEWMTLDRTLAVDCNVRNSYITHSQYASRRVKDAICDQFRDRTGGLRPSVDTEQPSLGLNLHISNNHAILSLDASWNSLHKRGYRPVLTRAPLNEALAAGLLMHLGYDGSLPLYDPMCGSGTFLIEGAWMGMRRPPALTRKWLALFGWTDFDRQLWTTLRDEARSQMLQKLELPLGGSDVRHDAIDFARNNSRNAGVGHAIEWIRCDLKSARPLSSVPGQLVCNPPYGERIGEERELILLHRALGETVQQHWPGWKLALFTSNARLAKQVRLPVTRTTPFYNGGLACNLYEYAASEGV